tara:strand:- start:1454 stop:1603 length:150 start_codon:yes stop_codon:yes gene_type:complete
MDLIIKKYNEKNNKNGFLDFDDFHTLLSEIDSKLTERIDRKKIYLKLIK